MPDFVIDIILSLRNEAGLVATVIVLVETGKQLPYFRDWLKDGRRKSLAAVVLTYVLGIAAYIAAVYLGVEAGGDLPGVLALLTLLAGASQVVYDKVVQPVRKAVRER